MIYNSGLLFPITNQLTEPRRTYQDKIQKRSNKLIIQEQESNHSALIHLKEFIFQTQF